MQRKAPALTADAAAVPATEAALFSEHDWCYVRGLVNPHHEHKCVLTLLMPLPCYSAGGHWSLHKRGERHRVKKEKSFTSWKKTGILSLSWWLWKLIESQTGLCWKGP